jgi:serine/threonine-protein kinase
VPDVNPELAAIVHKALAKWPAERQQSATELRDRLRALLPVLSPAKLAPAEAAPTRVDVPAATPPEALAVIHPDPHFDDRETLAMPPPEPARGPGRLILGIALMLALVAIALLSAVRRG